MNDEPGYGDGESDTSRPKDIHRARRRFSRRFTLLAVLAVAVAVAGGAIAAATLFSQNVPSGSAPAAGMSPNCATLAVDASETAASSGDAENVFGCGTNGDSAAFTVTTSGTYTPTFTLGSGLTSAYVVPAGSGAPANVGCGNVTNAKAIASGVGVALGTGGFDYCFDSAPGASYGSFAVSWA
jgi:hypothetical protein